MQEKRNQGMGEHGCKHYRRRCRMVAPCCGEVFWCRHCHNEAKTTNEWVSVCRSTLPPSNSLVKMQRRPLPVPAMHP